MLVSVIVPVFNASALIESTISSILAMRGPDLEVIAVDDGSTDGSAELLDSIAARDPRVRVLRQENSGASSARNAAILQSRGDILMLHDADDLSDPKRCIETLRWMEANPQLDFVGTWAWLIDGDDKISGALRPPPEPEECAARIQHSFPHCNPTLAFRRRALLPDAAEPRLYDESLVAAEDYELILRLNNLGLRGANIPKRLYYYRRHRGQLTLRDIVGNTYRAAIVQQRARGSEPTAVNAVYDREEAIRVVGSAREVDRRVAADLEHAFLASLGHPAATIMDVVDQASEFLSQASLDASESARLTFLLAMVEARYRPSLANIAELAQRLSSQPSEPLALGATIVGRRLHELRERVRHRVSRSDSPTRS